MILYAACLVLGLLFTVFSAVAGHFFGGHDGHMDVGTGGHAEAGFDHTGVPGISFFSPTVLASFVTAFGALGLVFTKIEATSSVWISAPLSALGGLGIASMVFWVFNSMFKKIQGSSESQVASLVGMEATVITPIPSNAVGEIAYVQGGTRYNAPARSEKGQAIASGQAVRITHVTGPQFVVEPKQ